MLATMRRKLSELQTEYRSYKSQAMQSVDELKSRNRAQEEKIAEMRKQERSWLRDAARLKEESKEYQVTSNVFAASSILISYRPQPKHCKLNLRATRIR